MSLDAGSAAVPVRDNRPMPEVDFSLPKGEAALMAADSVNWLVYKNLYSRMIGGVAATILELAEPRVRTGVWENSTFRHDPMPRLKRTGLIAMTTVYGPSSTAKKIIQGVNRQHAKVKGVTENGQPYSAMDAELLSWVNVTARRGFLEAYVNYVRPLSEKDRDRFYAEGVAAARLYGVKDGAVDTVGVNALFEQFYDKIEPSPIIDEFINVLVETNLLPWPFTPLQKLVIKAAVALIPEDMRRKIGLNGKQYCMSWWERSLVRFACRRADKQYGSQSIPVQACRRLGLPDDYLYQ
jgi:uncharacterized protein (DUF2236 family)